MSDCPLNETELSFVSHSADGKTLKEISAETGVSISYVDNHIKAARRIVRVRNTTGLVAKELREGWIT